MMGCACVFGVAGEGGASVREGGDGEGEGGRMPPAKLIT